jgi:hypothetical protein
MVTTLYQVMRSAGLSDAELRRRAAEELAKMVKRIRNGEQIRPLWRVSRAGYQTPDARAGFTKVQEIREKFGLKGGRDS